MEDRRLILGMGKNINHTMYQNDPKCETVNAKLKNAKSSSAIIRESMELCKTNLALAKSEFLSSLAAVAE